MLYEKIYNKLNNERYSGTLRSIYMDDNSIQFEDIVGDLYIYCISEDIVELNEEIITTFLKSFYKTHRIHRHSSLIEDISYDNEDDNCLDYDNMYVELSKDIDFTREEILCLLLIRDKKNMKKYDYTFIKRTDESSINKAKLRKHHEAIISKLLNKLSKGMTNKVSKLI